MGWDIPNVQTLPVGREAQARIFSVDLDTLVAGIAGRGVLSGFVVSEQTVPDMSVSVAAGGLLVDGAEVVKATPTTVAIGAAHGSLKRIDVVSVSPGLVFTATAGTPDVEPVAPDPPAGNVVLASVFVAPTVSSIVNADVGDRRVVLPLVKPAQRVTTATRTLLLTDGLVDMAFNGARTVTLPSVAVAAGRMFVVRRGGVSGSAVVVNRAGSDTILDPSDEATSRVSVSLDSIGASVGVYSTGSQWVVAATAGTVSYA